MNAAFIACGGPFFAPEGVFAFLAIFLVVKPITYYAFVRAFRFRVNRFVPMSSRTIGQLVGMRTFVGLLCIGSSTMVAANIWSQGSPSDLWTLTFGFAVIFGERMLVWFLLGRYGAGLAGRRLLGWTVSGTAIDAACDVAVGLSFDSQLHWTALALVGIALFVIGLEHFGTREALRSRFSADPRCIECGYNLTGNLSGVCPECGSPIANSIISRDVAKASLSRE